MVIDLRSDTVTRPTPGMRQAIAEAEVGDDVFGDDLTVRKLEERTAQLLGQEAGVFVPSGTMGNQLAVRCHTRPGDEVLLEADSHIFQYEAGAAAALSGVQLRPVPGRRGILAPPDLEPCLRADDQHHPRSRLLCLESTHNRAGGRIVPLAELTAAASWAREHGLRVHLDGARLWNAAAASGVPLDQFGRQVDSVMVCFSKGLGAPVGSVVVGSAAWTADVRRERKRFGGGMRQAGILAAACLYGLDHHRERLAEDHANARFLAERVAEIPGIDLDPETVETNIVVIDLTPSGQDVAAVLGRLKEREVLMVPFGPGQIRAVTHLDVDRRAVGDAASALAAAIGR